MPPCHESPGKGRLPRLCGGCESHGEVVLRGVREGDLQQVGAGLGQWVTDIMVVSNIVNIEVH